MAAHAKRALCQVSLLLFLFLIFCQFKYDMAFYKSSTYMLVSAGYDAKYYPGRNDGLRRSRYAASDTTLPALKAYRILNIAQFSLFAAGLILLAGDICPQPGPSFQLKNSGLSFGPQSRGLAMAHLNIRSLLHKMDQVNLIMGGTKSFDILSFSETWLNDSVTDDEILMPGYSCVRRDRQGKVGGGVAIYCRDSINFTIREDLNNANEAVWIQVNRKNCTPLVIGCIYRPPDQPIDNFTDNFGKSLSKIDPAFDKVALGDFNIDFSIRRRNANLAHKRLLKGIAELHDLKQVIESSTRVTEHSESLIDLCFTNAQQKITESAVLDPGLSDHSLIYCVMKSGRHRAPPKMIQFRSYKNYDKDSFVSDLRQVPWHVALNNHEDIDDCIDTWNKLFSEVAAVHAPIKTSRVRGFSIPWINSSIIALMNKRDHHLKKAKGNKNNTHWRLYRELRNKVTHSIKKAKSDYYTNLIINGSKSSSKDFWKALKQTLPSSKTSSRITSLLADGVLLTSAQSIASTLNSYFVNVGKSLAEKIVSEPYIAKATACHSTFTFQPISEDFVSRSISSLKTNKAVGLDKISARLLKDAVDVITPSLTALFNLSLQTRTFPSIWKTAKVIPLFKKGDKLNASNYRPISILPTVSKILEKAVHTQFYAYLTENNLISPNQFGFRLKSSTITATIQLSDQILHSMDNGCLTGAVFLDLAKAFDTVNHSILLQKLSTYGVDDAGKAWFTSFLTNRTQMTSCDYACSKAAAVSTGVAQGSILGPLLFIIYMNDLPDVLQSCQVTLYADDTVLYLASKSTVDLQSKINDDLKRICRWLRANQLTLNVQKSKFLLIGSSSRLNKVESILISADDTPLDNVDSFTYLGIVINNHFSWTDHIDYIRSKVSRKLGLLRRIKSCLPLNARIMFFNSFILPIFDYGDIIWGDRGNASLMSELQVLQNKAARLILDLPVYFSATEALKRLGWKPLLRRRKEHHAIFMYKLINNHSCNTIPVTFNRDFHGYNTRSRNDVRKSSATRRWGHWSSVNFSADVWNGLDISLRNANSLPAFKRGLSKFNFEF